MVNIIRVSMMVIFNGLIFFNPFANKAVKLDNQLIEHQVEPNNETNWPSFTDTSYNYILGLFNTQHNPAMSNEQTSQERAMFMSAVLLSQQYNMTVNGKQFAYRLEVTSGRDEIETLDRVCWSISENQILGVVGPTYSSEARTIARFCNRVGIPVIGYSNSDPELSDRNIYQTYYRMMPSDIVTAQALFKLFQKYNWNSTNIIYQNDIYGRGGRQALADVFINKVNISRAIKYDLFTARTNDFRRQLQKSPSRIVIVWATANVTREIINLALKAGNILAPSFLWIFTALHSEIELNNKQLAGMLLIRSVAPQAFNILTNTTLLKNATDIWKNHDPESYPGDEAEIESYALYAFDSAWLLILAFQEHCRWKPIDCGSLMNTTHCFDSRLSDRNELHQILQKIDFLGISGRVQFSEDTTDRLTSNGSHFIIDNLQLSKADTDEIRAVEVLTLNGNTSDLHHNSTTQWISKHSIIWPIGSSIAPVDYARLIGKLSAIESETSKRVCMYELPPFLELLIQI
jgi:ABC-type branched-subunit amino acid transport system substrate-binding protein